MDGGDLLFVCEPEKGFALFGRQVRDDKPFDSGLFRFCKEGCFPVFEDDVVVGHKQKRDGVGGRHLRAEGQAVGDLCAVGQTVLVGLEDHRAVGHGFGEGQLHLDAVHAVFNHLPDYLPVDLEGGIAEHDMGHQQDILFLQTFFKLLF